MSTSNGTFVSLPAAFGIFGSIIKLSGVSINGEGFHFIFFVIPTAVRILFGSVVIGLIATIKLLISFVNVLTTVFSHSSDETIIDPLFFMPSSFPSKSVSIISSLLSGILISYSIISSLSLEYAFNLLLKLSTINGLFT